MESKSKVCSIVFDKKLFRKLKKAVEEEDSDISKFIRQSVREKLERRNRSI